MIHQFGYFGRCLFSFCRGEPSGRMGGIMVPARVLSPCGRLNVIAGIQNSSLPAFRFRVFNLYRARSARYGISCNVHMPGAKQRQQQHGDERSSAQEPYPIGSTSVLFLLHLQFGHFLENAILHVLPIKLRRQRLIVFSQRLFQFIEIRVHQPEKFCCC